MINDTDGPPSDRNDDGARPQGRRRRSESPQAALTRRVAQNFLDYWSVQDVETTATLLGDDIVSVVYLDKKSSGMAGEIVGKDNVRQGLYDVLSTWHYLYFQGLVVRVHNDQARLQIKFHYQHIRTGLAHEGSMRMILTVQEGLITRVEAHHDDKHVDAYMARVRQKEAEMQAKADAKAGAKKRKAASKGDAAPNRKNTKSPRKPKR